MKRIIALLLISVLFAASSCGGDGKDESSAAVPTVARTAVAFADIEPYLTYKFQWENYSSGFDVIFYSDGSYVLDPSTGTVYDPDNSSVAFYQSDKSGYLYRIEFTCDDGNLFCFDINKKSVMVSDNKEFQGAYSKTVYTGGDYSLLKTYLPEVTSLHGLNFVPASGGDNIISFSKKNYLITLPDGTVLDNDNSNLSLSYDVTVNGGKIVYIDVFTGIDIVCTLTFKEDKFIYLNRDGHNYSYKLKTEE